MVHGGLRGREKERKRGRKEEEGVSVHAVEGGRRR
jgi:hypothetical protein